MMFPTNRYQRSGTAIALAMPWWWTVLVAMLATAICEPLSDIGAIFIAAGTRLLTSAGKRKLKGGKRRVSNGTNSNCCCCPACANCTDSVPAAFIVTFSGMSTCNTTCTQCPFPNLNSSFQNIDNTTINGTYTLTCRSETACAWYLNVDGLGHFQRFCLTSPITRTDVDFNLTKEEVGGTKRFFLGAQTAIAGSGDHFQAITNTNTCNNAGGYSFTNNNVGCGNCSWFSSGGTATATPV